MRMLHCAAMMDCTLLVPDLLPAALRDHAAVCPRVPQLAALLARGDTVTLPPGEFESWLCGAFGVARQNDWPVAPLTLAEDGGNAGNGFWLRCDPAHIYLQQHRMILSDAAGTPSADESAALIEALNAHFRADGPQFFAGGNGRWYVRDDAHARVTTCFMSEAMHRDIDSLLPAGDDGRHWRRVMNEIQMLLHAHPLNMAREARGLPAFNSLWLWGGGTAPPAASSSFSQVCSDDPLARALARHAAAAVAGLPESAEAMIAAGGHALAVITKLRDARDFESWCAALEECERQWFAPCSEALHDGRMQSLTIVAPAQPYGRQFTISTSHRWRWWRRAKPIAAHV
jgi:hypothetical protein